MTRSALSCVHEHYSIFPGGFEPGKVTLQFCITPDLISTATCSQLLEQLDTLQPSVFCSNCRNYKNQSFRKEVVETETAHLFEHLLLDWLRSLKLSKGAATVQFIGETTWDWKKSPRGTFTIELLLPDSDRALLPEAITRTVHVFNQVLPRTIP